MRFFAKILHIRVFNKIKKMTTKQIVIQTILNINENNELNIIMIEIDELKKNTYNDKTIQKNLCNKKNERYKRRFAKFLSYIVVDDYVY